MTFFKLLKQSPLSARIGAAIILLNILAAVFAPWLSPYSETEIVIDIWMGGDKIICSEPINWAGIF